MEAGIVLYIQVSLEKKKEEIKLFYFFSALKLDLKKETLRIRG